VDLTRAPAEETGLHSLIAACLPVFTQKQNAPFPGFPVRFAVHVNHKDFVGLSIHLVSQSHTVLLYGRVVLSISCYSNTTNLVGVYYNQ
jgi:hypothetical protein